jgi:hypothetical protein
LVIFGGDSLRAQFFNDVWVLPVDGPPVWQPLTVAGTPPPTRTNTRAVYDAGLQRMIVYSGFHGSDLDDVWTLSLDATPTWTRITYGAPAPAPRNDHSMVFDPVSGRVIVCGGRTTNSLVGMGDVWAFDPNSAQWQQLSAGSASFAPRYGHAAIYDPIHSRMVVQGGVGFERETWAFALDPDGDWSPLVLRRPAVGGAASVFDPVHRQMILYGGSENGGALGETWTLPLADPAPHWTRVFPAGTAPGPRAGHVATWDRLRGRMLVLGGRSNPASGDGLWSFTPDPPTWAPVATQGTYPTGKREFAGMVYDADHDRLLVFGGNAIDASVWALPLGGPGVPTWSTLPISGPAPTARYYHSFVLDPARAAAYVMDGFNNPDEIHVTHFDDLWKLDLASDPPAWSPLTLANRPAQRVGHAAVYDPTNDRMLVFGGQSTQLPGGPLYNDSRGLTLFNSAWSDLTPTGTPPSGRLRMSAVVDVPGNRLVVFGGDPSSGNSDTWFLTWPASASVGGPVAGEPRLRRVTFDRGRREIRIELESLPSATGRIDVLDLAGRRVISQRLEAAAAVGNEIRLPASELKSGLYFVRFQQLGVHASARFIVLR